MKKSTGDLFEELKKKRNVNEFIKENQSELIFDSLKDMIEFFMNQKGLEKKAVVKRSQLGNYAYYIIKGEKKNPDRDKLIMLCFGLRLNADEANQLLRMASVGILYSKKIRDIIIINALNFNLDVTETNIKLEDAGEDILPLP